MTSPLRREVLGGYRRLMRARLTAFRGDTQMLQASREQLRIEFDKNKDVVDEGKIAGLIKGINEVEEMLRFNIAQARLNERGNYAVNVAPRQPSKDGIVEVEHIGRKAGDLPDTDVTVTKSSPAAAAAAAGDELERKS